MKIEFLEIKRILEAKNLSNLLISLEVIKVAQDKL